MDAEREHSSEPEGAPAAERGYVVVARLDEVPPGTVKAVRYGDEPVVLVNVEGQVYALADRCLHVGAPLADGHVRNGMLVCGWHAWQYDPASGRVREPRGVKIGIPVYPVRLDGDLIAVGPPDEAAPPA
jgi:nitrite reductase/ring-hydroxylating ferredoxin subunit